MVVLVVVLVWLVALVPVALRRHSAYQVHASVARFRRQRRLLERAYRSRVDGTDVTLAAPLAAERGRRSYPRHSSVASVPGLRQRRVRVLSTLGSALAISLVLGAVPVLRAFWTAAIFVAAALTAYVVLLARFTAVETSVGRQRCVGSEDRLHAPEDWVNPHLEGDGATRDADMTRPPWVRMLVEERSA